jgi:SecD/SecF fusion protein
MQGKKGLVFFASVITALCLFYLSFTFVAKGIRSDQKTFAEEKRNTAQTNGVTGDELNQVYKDSWTAYRDSIWNEPVYFDWTYADVKKFELNLGLDLQGGMHITLMVDAKEFMESKSGFSKNVKFNQALKNAYIIQQNSQEKFTDIFYQEWLKGTNGQTDKLAPEVFYSRNNEKHVKRTTSDQDVMNWINSELEEAATLSKEILANRIDEFGATQPIIEVVGSTGRIEIELPGVDDEERIKKRVSAAAQLKFMEDVKGNESFQVFQQLIPKMPTEIVEIEETTEENIATPSDDLSATDDLSAESSDDSTETLEVVDTVAEQNDEITEEDELVKELKPKTEERPRQLIQVTNYYQDPADSRLYVSYAVLRKDKKELEAFLARSDVQASFPKGISVYFGKPEVRSTGVDEADVIPLYFLKTNRNGMPLMGGPGTPDYIDDAYNGRDQKGKPAVFISFNSKGAVEWGKTTGKAASNQFNVAIVLDDIVYSAPRVKEKITGGGNTIIQGNFTLDESKELASVLKSGKLRIKTSIEGVVVVGPSLGKEAVDRGLISIVAGLVLVIIFMVMYYGKGGFIADIALIFNIFFILGILSVPSLGAALTLPGIAGIVLTMGMSIDANVLIFERIKEEIKNGVSAKAAIQIGYKKAFTTILDANLTTLITAFILFAFGTGVVKGFATTLIVGVLSSFFSAVYITRLIIEFIVNKNGADAVGFETTLSKSWFTKHNFDIISKRKTAYIFSAIVIAIGIGSIVAQGGLNLGVDFQGGRSYIVKFDKDVKASEVRSDIKAVLGDASCEVKTIDGDNQVKIKTNYMLSAIGENVDDIVKETIVRGLDNYTSLNPDFVQSIKVNPTISADIKAKSLESVILSLVAIFFYILLRFKKAQFGIGALIALFHDVLIVISIFSIVRLLGISFEIDSIFIAAMLTIVGYSINDTVVVFDRVREYVGKASSTKDLIPIFNEAVNSTLSRTLMTSLTTLIVVAILLIFGGEALRGFSFALLIGVIVGTYSSLFIATPSVLDTSKKSISDSKNSDS